MEIGGFAPNFLESSWNILVFFCQVSLGEPWGTYAWGRPQDKVVSPGGTGLEGPLKGLIRPFKGLIEPFKGLIGPFKGPARPVPPWRYLNSLYEASLQKIKSMKLVLLLKVN